MKEDFFWGGGGGGVSCMQIATVSVGTDLHSNHDNKVLWKQKKTHHEDLLFKISLGAKYCQSDCIAILQLLYQSNWRGGGGGKLRGERFPFLSPN